MSLLYIFGFKMIERESLVLTDIICMRATVSSLVLALVNVWHTQSAPVSLG